MINGLSIQYKNATLLECLETLVRFKNDFAYKFFKWLLIIIGICNNALGVINTFTFREYFKWILISHILLYPIFKIVTVLGLISCGWKIPFGACHKAKFSEYINLSLSSVSLVICCMVLWHSASLKKYISSYVWNVLKQQTATCILI